MKDGPPARVPEADPFKTFDKALRKIVGVSKDELLKRERAYKRQRARNKSRRSKPTR